MALCCVYKTLFLYRKYVSYHCFFLSYLPYSITCVHFATRGDRADNIIIISKTIINYFHLSHDRYLNVLGISTVYPCYVDQTDSVFRNRTYNITNIHHLFLPHFCLYTFYSKRLFPFNSFINIHNSLSPSADSPNESTNFNQKISFKSSSTQTFQTPPPRGGINILRLYMCSYETIPHRVNFYTLFSLLSGVDSTKPRDSVFVTSTT